MITRVSDDGESVNLGQNIMTQVFKEYKAIFAAAALLLLLAFLPGMPSTVFILLCGVFTFTAITILRKKKKDKLEATDLNTALVEESSTSNSGESILQNESFKLIPVILYLSPEFKNSMNNVILKQNISLIQQQIFKELGVLIPQVVIRYNEQLKDNEYQLLVFEIPVVTGIMYWDSLLLLDDNKNAMQLLDLEGSLENSNEFGETILGRWIKNTNSAICDEYELRYLSFNQFLIQHFNYYIKKYISEFFGIQEVIGLFDSMVDYQDLIKELLRMLPLNKITEILQRLISENISIRNFKVILDALLEWGQKEKEPLLLSEYVRKSLGRYISYKFSNASYLFACITLSIDVENIIRDSIRYVNDGSYLAIDPEISLQIVNEVRRFLDEGNKINNLIVITHLDIRRYVRSILEKDFPFLAVLSYQELEGHAELNSVLNIEI